MTAPRLDVDSVRSYLRHAQPLVGAHGCHMYHYIALQRGTNTSGYMPQGDRFPTKYNEEDSDWQDFQKRNGPYEEGVTPLPWKTMKGSFGRSLTRSTSEPFP